METLFRVLIGSRAHGLHTEESDFDIRGVYLLPTVQFLGIDRAVEVTDKKTDVHWEVAHFCRMALKCNPNAIEAMAAPPLHVSPDGAVLRSMLPLFLSKKEIVDAYKGFAGSQKKQALQGVLAPQRVRKFCSHYLRSLYSGEYLLRTGAPLVNVVGTEAEEPCRRAKFGGMDIAEVFDLGVRLEERIDIACQRSVIADEPDRGTIEKWLIDLRIAHLIRI